MLKTYLIAALLMTFALPAIAADAPRAKVLSTDKDRTGKRFANKYQVKCDAAGEVWDTGKLNRATRKMVVKAGAAPLRIGVSATPGSIGEMINGTRITNWYNLPANASLDYGSPQQLVVLCTGPGQFYAHAEWYRQRSSLLDMF